MDQKKIKVWVLTSIIPIQEIQNKKDENDIIILNGDAIEKRYDDVVFYYGFVFPKATRLTGLLSPKWKSYFKLSLKDFVFTNNKKIFLFPILLVPKYKVLNKILGDISFILNKKRITSFIQLYSPTIVHAHSVKSDGYLAYKIFKKYNIPYVLTIREFSTNNILPEVIQNAKKIISINSVDGKNLNSLFNKQSVFLPHGVAQKFFKEKVHGQYEVIRFVIVSRLIPLKNIDLIIRSLSKFEHDYIFDIYGDGVEFQKIKDLIIHYNLEKRIKLKGYISNDELSNLYSSYDVFIMPSKPEALGRVYFEAMASGLPVIAAKFTGIDGIIEDGKHGFLIDVNEQGTLENCLKIIFEKPDVLKQMSEEAIKLANQFKLSEIIKKSYEIYF